jgi:tRNA-Thr(GGU) m(6)t(6)A37 methyltransferase TsaA
MRKGAITLHPIGYVRRRPAAGTDPDRLRRALAEIVVEPALASGLEGIEHCPRLVVLFYCHRSQGLALRVHPRGDPQRSLRGVFATRSPARPNPLGLTVVTLVGVRGNVLQVLGLDALDGTPVLDLKPFAPVFDAGVDAQPSAASDAAPSGDAGDGAATAAGGKTT